ARAALVRWPRAIGPPSAATFSMATSAPRGRNAITALQIHRRCAKPPNRRIESDLYSELDRGARRRKPGAHADQPAPAPVGRPAGYRARGGVALLPRSRPRLHRHGGGAVVRFARLRLRAARQSRLRADAKPRLLPSLSPPLERARHCACRDAARNRARAHG